MMVVTPAVVPVLIGPLQALLAILPGILLSLAGVLLSLLRPSSLKTAARLLWSQKAVVLPVAAIVVALVMLRGRLFPGMRGAGALVAGEDWPMSRGSADRRGFVASGAGEPDSGTPVWSFTQGDFKTFYASPAVAGNRVYAIASQFGVFKNRGLIVCLDADTGGTVWTFSGDGFRSTFSSPAVAGRYLVSGEGLHQTRDARVFCFDRQASEERGQGVKLWEFRTASHVESSPCIDGGRVFVGAGDDGLYCLAIEPGAGGVAQVLWHADGGTHPDCETSPVACDGRVYFGLGNGGQAVVCLDAATGRELWKTSTPHPVFGSPAVAGGRVVVGMGIGNYVKEPEEMAADLVREMRKEGKSDDEIRQATASLVPAGAVWCLDVESGTVLWRCDAPARTVLGSPAIAGERVYFGSRDRRLYEVSVENGAVQRTWNAGAPIISGISVGERLVYCLTQNGVLCALDRSTFDIAWAAPLYSSTMSSPAAARGRVYVATEEKGLLCIGGREGEAAEGPLWQGYIGAGGALVPGRTKFRWRYTPVGPAGESMAATSPMALVNGALYIGVSGGSNAGLACLALGFDDSLLQEPEPAWFHPSDNPVRASPAATSNRVVFVDGSVGEGGRRVRCLDAATGSVRWSRAVATEASGAFLLTRSRVFLAAAPEALVCLALDDGHVLWTIEADMVDAPVLVDGILFFLCDNPPALQALDALSGVRLWSAPLDEAPGRGPVGSRDALWVASRSGSLRRADPASGRWVGRIAAGDAIGSMTAGSGRIAAATVRGGILVAGMGGSETGSVLRIAGGAPSLPPLPGRNALVYATPEGVRRYDWQTGEDVVLQKLYPKYDGVVVSPAVVYESHILYATQKRGLICLMPK